MDNYNLRKILEEKKKELYCLKKQRGDFYNDYKVFQAMMNNHDLDKLIIEIELLKLLILP